MFLLLILEILIVYIPGNTSDFRLGELPLKTGNHLQFIFDLLDEWAFDLQLEKIEPANPKMKKPKILEIHGEAPTQYGEEEEVYSCDHTFKTYQNW
ncbi:plasmid pRiA4b ORF-3 family protein [Tolypothrix sp. PCC 7910]|uniref:plasmid pRiA4b ORF-3 family protein n=1 Tax=Tolypothrix sp. PCC 7910 TaxID=2099387 RepID=UPI001FCA8BEB|nr:plasmid pRiA4b ORF-3 family protein [Tolypothrix sp. PCC 7910]